MPILNTRMLTILFFSRLLNRPEEFPLLLCHGDLSPSNIIYDPIRRNVTFIDLEMAGTNYQVRNAHSCFPEQY